MYNNLKKLREQRGLNMKEMAGELNIPYTTYVGYEKGEREPSSDVLIKIANYYNTSVDYILGVTTTQDVFSIPNIIPIPKMKNVPLLGTIACGEPILAEENIENYVNVDAKANVDFALKCKGDSMINARIFDGDIVYIHSQPDVENGEIAAVLIGNEATLKKVHKYPNKLVLSPCNPMYDDLVYSEEQLENVRILGKAVIFASIIK